MIPEPNPMHLLSDPIPRKSLEHFDVHDVLCWMYG